MYKRKIVIEIFGHKFYEDGVKIKGERVYLTCAPGCCTTPYHCSIEMHIEHYETLLRQYKQEVHVDSILSSVRK